MHDDEVERHQNPNEVEGLLSKTKGWMEMADLRPQRTAEEENLAQFDARYKDDQGHAEASRTRQVTRDGKEVALADRGQHVEYRVYKIRWFGLTQLILLNIVVSWDVSRSTELHMYEVSMTDFLTAVALLLCSRQHSSRLLFYDSQHHQLAEHRLPIRLSRCSSCYNLDTPYRWTSSRHHYFFATHLIR